MRREGESWSFYRGDTLVAPGGGDSPPCRARGLGPAAVARGLGDRAFFFQGPHCEFKKNLHLRPVALWGATGGIFEIFQNGHIFLNFLFFLNIKKKKPPLLPTSRQDQAQQRVAGF